MYRVLPLNFTHCTFKFIFNLGSDCSVLYNMTKKPNNMSPAREEEDNTSIKHNYNKTAAITADVF